MGNFQTVRCWKTFRYYRRFGRLHLESWKRGDEDAGSVAVEVLPDAQLSVNGQPYHGRGAVVIRYRHTPYNGEPENVENVIPLTWTSPNYGGARPWFACPHCLRRVGILALAGRAFLCRRCLGLAYEVQRERRSDRLMRKRDKLEARLRPDGGKPKGMHWRTYERIREQADAADCLSMAVSLAEIRGRFGLATPGM